MARRRNTGVWRPCRRHASDRPQPPILTLVRFGLAAEHLFVRLDGTRRLLDLLAEGYEFSVRFLKPEDVRFSVREVAGRMSGSFWERRDEAPYWFERGPGRASVGAGTILEFAVPLADLPSSTSLTFFVSVFDAAGTEVERHPENRSIEAEVPTAGFEARNWTA